MARRDRSNPDGEPPPASIVWFRRDLRLDDNPALHAATDAGGGVIPVYIHEPESDGAWPPGGASRCWLHGSLESLDASLRAAGSRLVLRRGRAIETLSRLLDETGAAAVYWNRRYEPAAIACDGQVEAALRARGVVAESFPSQLLFEPWAVATRASTPFRVFTPFYKACLARPEPDAPLEPPAALAPPARWPASAALQEFELRPRIPWDAGIRQSWDCGEPGARAQLDRFVRGPVSTYLDTRDGPGADGSSRLSPYLHFGELSPRRVWHAVRGAVRDAPPGPRGSAQGFLRELVWREFAHHLLFHFPRTPEAPLDPRFERFPWRDDPRALRAWQRGKTGFPILDAGMRQLWETGWLPNRVRMLVGSFLVKDLLVPWRRGAEWFWDTLVDADLANNTLGWQWVAGCGADASPFFRVFNPVRQGKTFDPEGDYVRRWVPELSGLPARWVHEPGQAPPAVLRGAGVVLGRTYPRPMVDHDQARGRALAAFGALVR